MSIANTRLRRCIQVLKHAGRAAAPAPAVAAARGQGQLPFGGVNQSGMGSYHGVVGFKAFSHARASYIQEGH